MPSVIAPLALAFLLIPIAELFLIVKVSSAIGVLDTLGLLIVISVLGAWLVRREGLGVWRRMNASLAQGQVPGTELVDGMMILMGGALMLTPGFLTDALGLSLLIPPVRALLRGSLSKRLTARVQMGGNPMTFGRGDASGGGFGFSGNPYEPRRPTDGVWDTTGHEKPGEDPTELGPDAGTDG